MQLPREIVLETTKKAFSQKPSTWSCVKWYDFFDKKKLESHTTFFFVKLPRECRAVPLHPFPDQYEQPYFFPDIHSQIVTSWCTAWLNHQPK